MTNNESFSHDYSSVGDEETSNSLRHQLFKIVEDANLKKSTTERLESLKLEIEKAKKEKPNDIEIHDIDSIFQEFLKRKEEGLINMAEWESVKKIKKRLIKETEKYETPPYRIPTVEFEEDSDYKGVSMNIKNIGVENISYIVKSENPNAPTIILAPQSHYDMNDIVYNTAKQIYKEKNKENLFIKQLKEDHDTIVNAINSANPEKLYLELESFDSNDCKAACGKYQATHSGWEQIIEDIPYVGLEAEKKISEHAIPSGRDAWLELRANIGNVHQADIVIDDLKSNNHSSGCVVIGNAHENENFITMSSVLAASGINVIVLNGPRQNLTQEIKRDSAILRCANIIFTIFAQTNHDPERVLDNIFNKFINENLAQQDSSLGQDMKLTYQWIKNDPENRKMFVQIVKKSISANRIDK